MPPSARKSSVGAARRATQKSHVPYRGDDPTVGRRTGISVQSVPRGSDGFEPFEKLIDEHAPTKLRKKRKVVAHDEEDEEEQDEDQYDDEDGEMSMDVDSPIQNYANARPPNTPRNQRPISRTSEVDFDQVPSPRTHSSARRSTPGPSRLAAQQLLEQDEDDNDFDGGGNDTYGGDNDNDYGVHNPGDSPRQLSFTEMDTRDDEEEEDDEPPVSSPKRGKGKARAVEQDVEDDIARGMDDVDMGAPESDEEPPAPKSPPKKALPPVKAKAKPPPKPASSTRKENRKDIREGYPYKDNREIPPGVRRSARVPIWPPLEWWRNERIEFGGRDPAGGRVLVPPIKAVIRIGKEPVVPLGKHARGGRKTSAKPASKGGVKVVEKIVERIVQVEGGATNLEEGWDDETESQAVVKAYPGNEDVTRRIAFTAKMFSPVPAANNEWFFQKIFGDGDFIAAGQIVIPPKGRKPSKPSKDNTFIFYVIEGAVNLKVCETSVIVASGGMFMIPRGNTYFIENIADRDAKLFFTQARKMREGEEDESAQSDGPLQAPQRAVSVAGLGRGGDGGSGLGKGKGKEGGGEGG
ncbi:Mif2/CENP-C like-domain-containing protein [Mycena alexandri]|uniref:CENP-C homolog n=1 Tax=Mycena alexandri TaxID=1745969 RepID=A0AAD6WVY6_9AGAR|nr:Mif2/CENP-C like-domain-containing protein [Mycena alexandri]